MAQGWRARFSTAWEMYPTASQGSGVEVAEQRMFIKYNVSEHDLCGCSD